MPGCSWSQVIPPLSFHLSRTSEVIRIVRVRRLSSILRAKSIAVHPLIRDSTAQSLMRLAKLGSHNLTSTSSRIRMTVERLKAMDESQTGVAKLVRVIALGSKCRAVPKPCWQ